MNGMPNLQQLKEEKACKLFRNCLSIEPWRLKNCQRTAFHFDLGWASRNFLCLYWFFFILSYIQQHVMEKLYSCKILNSREHSLIKSFLLICEMVVTNQEYLFIIISKNISLVILVYVKEKTYFHFFLHYILRYFTTPRLNYTF